MSNHVTSQGRKKRRADHDEVAIEDNRRHRRIARAFVAMILSADSSIDKIKNYVEYSFPAEVIAGIKISQTYSEAINDSKYSDNWRLAMSQEIAGLGENGTWKEVIPPEGANLVSSKWVYTIKLDVDHHLRCNFCTTNCFTNKTMAKILCASR